LRIFSLEAVISKPQSNRKAKRALLTTASFCCFIDHFRLDVFPTQGDPAMTTAGIDTLNSLLRGELAATETYQQALATMANDLRAGDVRRIHEEHRSAANTLCQEVHRMGGKPDQGSGALGAFAKMVEGTATLFGNAAALKALEVGER
jgi:hypothetical protein